MQRDLSKVFSEGGHLVAYHGGGKWSKLEKECDGS